MQPLCSDYERDGNLQSKSQSWGLLSALDESLTYRPKYVSLICRANRRTYSQPVDSSSNTFTTRKRTINSFRAIILAMAELLSTGLLIIFPSLHAVDGCIHAKPMSLISFAGISLCKNRRVGLAFTSLHTCFGDHCFRVVVTEAD